MSESDLQHIHEDLELVKDDLALIKHILIEEGELSEEALQRLEKARNTPLSKYTQLWEQCGIFFFLLMLRIFLTNKIRKLPREYTLDSEN